MGEEQKIRELIRNWSEATAKGDVSRVLELMSDDVVFLLSGEPPIHGREAFAKGFREGLKDWSFHSESDIREIATFGDWGYSWSSLTVTITARNESGLSAQRSGDVLSIFRKEPSGNWVLVRDANMLTAKETPKKT